ncbi:MAG: 4-hydroxyphenylpyruvate dioxygenase [Acidimicrobiales bacterium]|jgi:4-hydroxyphenylpyruvate dioxygenase
MVTTERELTRISDAPDGATAQSEKKAPEPASLLTGFDHIEMWVGNARAVTQSLESGFGFECTAYAGPETGLSDRVSYVLEQGGITFVVTAGLSPSSPITQHVLRHGDGVRTVAFSTEEVDKVFDTAVLRGAVGVAEPASKEDETGVIRTATIATYGETEHTFVDRSGYEGVFGPKFTTEGIPRFGLGRPADLNVTDHVVGNVEDGKLDEWVEWYERVLGFTQMRHFDADQISTEFSALRSTVVWNGGSVCMPINEPAAGKRKSQIQEYLESYGSPGVQHIAMSTRDIVHSVDELRRRGVRFLVPPSTYYEDAKDRVGNLDIPWADLERLGILVDVDGGGYLLQVFTETLSDRPTLFCEVIQREGATGFGDGNFKALFEAIEREQAKRGNL